MISVDGDLVSPKEAMGRSLQRLRAGDLCPELERSREALRHLRRARDSLVEGGWSTDLIDAAMSAVPVMPPGMNPELHWLEAAHLLLATEDLADLLDLDEDAVADRISVMHAYHRRAAGQDQPCWCGHPFGRPVPFGRGPR